MAERERDDAEQLRRSWIANASAWSETVRGRKIESRRVGTDAAIVAVVVERNPRRVLDLGCGEGWLARGLAERGIEVMGVDASPALTEAANELGGGVFRVASYEELAGLDEMFDLVVANFSLLQEELQPVLSALRDKAPTLIVQTVHPAFAGGDYVDGWRTETFAAMEGEWPEPMPWYFRTVGSWVRVLREGGYNVAEVREPLHPQHLRPLSILFVATVTV
jgi:SAM-dependent methyltransferase